MSDTSILRLRPSDLAGGRPYAERDEREPPLHDRVALAVWHGMLRPWVQPAALRRRQAQALVARVNLLSVQLADANDAQLQGRLGALRRHLRSDGFALEPVAQCFALVRAAAARVIGKRHYDCQLMAGWWLLQGNLVEMATGEGKTLMATLPAVAAALAGLPVHIITVNDYLAQRDALTMAPVYHFFGLRVGAVVHGMAPVERRRVYGGDIAYASNKELAFDYLRDRNALGDRASLLHLATESLLRKRAHGEATVLRGLVFGIVDEADSVFIDEARTPLILSRTVDGATLQAHCTHALAMARALQEGEHFTLERATRRVHLSDAGRKAGDAVLVEGADAPFNSERERDEALRWALAALHLYLCDQQYVVVDGKVQIVDESTGRAMPDRAWERGLHQMIEAKESLELTGTRETLARITYQRLFRRYLRLAGMSGTATEVAVEIARTYGPAVVRVPLHRPSRRVMLAPQCLPDAARKWQRVVERVARVARQDLRPVLVGTRTVQASELLSAMLTASGIAHVVLNARQDGDEAAIVAQAGEAGRVTVATNMAGRGTDIELGAGVAERGGLHVILTEFNDSPRVDRQLFGRCARQGEPGSGETIVALDDELFALYAAPLSRLLGRLGLVRPWALSLLVRVAQAAAEQRNRGARDSSLRQDRRFAQILAFAGRGE